MASLTSTEIILVAFVIVLAVVSAGVLLLLIRRLRSRKAKLLSELDDRPELSQDRAFNRLAMARRESGILARQGVDVHRAQELIAESQGAFDTHQFDQSYRIAQSAHEALVNARQKGAMSTGTPLPSKGTGTANLPENPRETGTVAATPVSPSPAVPALPKNRAESHFQMRILSDELDALGGRRARDPAVEGAKALRDQAQVAFDKGDFTDAFRLALRGRRTLGGTVEGLAAVVPATGGGGPGMSGPGSATADPTQTAEAVAGGERCPDCGYPALAGDGFCRGCGRPRTTITCASCGAARIGDEAFCGRCGARFP
ncbi:MAG: zinc ribbon domain-containing protein [Thermoplasmata archaeon]